MRCCYKFLFGLVILLLVPASVFAQFKLLDFQVDTIKLSHDGTTIVGEYEPDNPDDDSDGFIWSESTGLNQYSTVTEFTGVNEDGTLAIGEGTDDDSHNRAILWDGDLTAIEDPIFVPTNMSADGSTYIGMGQDDNGKFTGPIEVVGGDAETLDGGPDTLPENVSADGSIIVGYDFTNNKVVYWQNGAETVLEITPPAGDIIVLAQVNAAGTYIAGTVTSGKGYIYEIATGKYTYFSAPAGYEVLEVTGISDDGAVVGSYLNAAQTAGDGFIWFPGQASIIDLVTYFKNIGANPPSGLCVPYGISGNGQVVCGIHLSGVSDQTSNAFIAGVGGPLDSLTIAGEQVYQDVQEVQGGDSVVGTVTLLAAQKKDILITLTSSETGAATVPTSVTIPAGETSATFTIKTDVVSEDTSVIINAGYGSQLLQTQMFVLEPALEDLSIEPSNVTGGETISATISLNAKQPTALVIKLESSNDAATVPASVLIPVGKTSVDFDIKTSAVAINTIPVITASAQGKSLTANLTVLAAQIATFKISPTSVLNGTNAVGEVTLTGDAPPGGQTLYLKTNMTSVSFVPPSVTISAGQNSISFPIATLYVASKTTPTITATYLAVPRTATFTVNPGTYPYLTPNHLSTAYGNATLQTGGYKGQGMKIGIFSPTLRYKNDTSEFVNLFGITGFTVNDVLVDGGPAASSLNGDGYLEASLDIETILGQAPGSTVEVVEPSDSDQAEIDAFIEMGKLGVSVISSSWGYEEAGLIDEGTTGTTFASDFENETKSLAASGVSIFVAAGDSGAFSRSEPSVVTTTMETADPYATAVGGTSLVVSSSGAYTDETAWTYNKSTNSGGGGGLSQIFGLPTWQTGPGVKNTYANGKRQVPDVAANADPATGYIIIANGQLITVGGTSASTPLWAGNVLLIDQAFKAKLGSTFSLGFLNPALYTLGTDFENLALQQHGSFFVYHDVTVGNDGLYPAGTEWDFCTGWGSANFPKLLDDLGLYYGKGPSLPDYQPYTPTSVGYVYPVTIHTSATSLSEPTTFTHTEGLYFAISVANRGTADAPSAETVLEIDGKVVASSLTLGALDLGEYLYQNNFYHTTLSAGTHTITLIANYGNKVAESNTGNDIFTRTITVK